MADLRDQLPSKASDQPLWLEARVAHARAHRGKYVAAILVLAFLLALSGVVVTTRSISRRSALDTLPDARPPAPARRSIVVLPLARLLGRMAFLP